MQFSSIVVFKEFLHNKFIYQFSEKLLMFLTFNFKVKLSEFHFLQYLYPFRVNSKIYKSLSCIFVQGLTIRNALKCEIYDIDM